MYPSNQGGYRNMNNSLNKYFPGTLHTLYPGKYLGTPHYSGIDIPHEHPELLARILEEEAQNVRESRHLLHNINLELGGIGKINRHPAVEPERTIEDPQLSGLSIRPPIETDQYTNPHARNLSEGQIRRGLANDHIVEKNIHGSALARAEKINTPLVQKEVSSYHATGHPNFQTKNQMTPKVYYTRN